MAERHRRNKDEESRKKTTNTSKVSLSNKKESSGSSSKKNPTLTKRSSSKEPDKKNKLIDDESKKINGDRGDSKRRDSTSKATSKTTNGKASSTKIPEPSKENSTKSSSSKEDKSRSKKERLPSPEPLQQYDDDFEDYESDFEEDIEDDAEQPKKDTGTLSGALIEDTRIGESMLLKRLATAHANRANESVQDSRQIDFSANNQSTTTRSQRAMSAQRKFSFVQSPANTYDADIDSSVTGEESMNTYTNHNRVDTEQQQLAKLKSSQYYDYFQQLSGANAQLIQTSTQTGEDNVPMGCQTDLPDTSNAVTQHPAHFTSFSPAASETDAALEEHTNVLAPIQSSSKQSEGQLQRLTKFVSIAGELLVNLLNAERSEEPFQLHMQHNSNIMLSSRYTTFSVETIVKECRTSCVTRSPSRGHNILYAIYIPNSPNPLLNKKSLLLECDLEQPVSPARIFHCENEVTCCCYSSDGNTAIFAGLKDGSCVAWDLREPEALHNSRLVWNQSTGNDGGIALRTPAYDTSYAVLEKDRLRRMESPMVAITASSSTQTSANSSSSSSSQQVVTVNEAGTLTVWATLDNYGINKPFEQDLGMAPEAKLKLTRISTLNCFSSVPHNSLLKSFGAPTISCVEPVPHDHLHFLVGTTKGNILKVKKIRGQSGASGPRVFSTDKDMLTEVTCIRFSPFEPEVFAASSYSSNIFLFHLSHSQPLRVLSPAAISSNVSGSCRGLPVTSLEWSQSASQVLYTIHDTEQLLIWDVEGEDGSSASVSDSINFVKEYRSKILATAIWRNGEEDKRSTNSFMAFALVSGQVMVHCLEKVVSRKRRQSSDNLKSNLFKQLNTDILQVKMTLFHFGNCVILAYAPYLIAYKYSSLSEYSSWWKCANAALVYFVTQFLKMMTLATFFPTSAVSGDVEAEGFNLISELVKNSVDVVDVLGLHLAISYFISGKGEIRFLAAGLGWAGAHSLASYFVGLFVGSRTTGFHWRYIQTAMESNVDLVFYMSMATLVWLFNRIDMAKNTKRMVGLLLVLCVFHDVVYQMFYFKVLLRSWSLIGAKAAFAIALASMTLFSYASLGSVVHQKSN
uniref:BOS complex subunit TMEM147 n=1 Tax=Ditylenchus dipsaci TaxID=166011 RepID=A0A915EM58_9BILA